MDQFIIQGGVPLSGSMQVYGAKNAVLPILAGCLLSREELIIKNVPGLQDVHNMEQIMSHLGCRIRAKGSQVSISTRDVHTVEMPEQLSCCLRSSIFMLGSMLSRFKKAVFYSPGGCEIGLRPIDLHVKGLEKMNVKVTEEGGRIICDGSRMKGAEIVLDYPSVGATENLMMAGVLIPGETVIHNSAREPEIVDLQNFLNGLGAKISGAGTGVIRVEGVNRLVGGEYTVMPDRIVAGTYLVAGAITGGDLMVKNADLTHLQNVVAKLKETGCRVHEEKDGIRIIGAKRLREIPSLVTAPYPGFPTDMQAQLFALACVCRGSSVIVENVFENRFKHAPELTKMGANITIKDRIAVIRGVETLHGAVVNATDLRGGAALVLAGLGAQGETAVKGIHYIDRGYEALEQALSSVGGDIIRKENLEESLCV